MILVSLWSFFLSFWVTKKSSSRDLKIWGLSKGTTDLWFSNVSSTSITIYYIIMYYNVICVYIYTIYYIHIRKKTWYVYIHGVIIGKDTKLTFQLADLDRGRSSNSWNSWNDWNHWDGGASCGASPASLQKKQH